ncbi:MAG: DUF4422 domain-containing protein [Dorea sp.]|jgi:hypothetical protein|nr:DUF4422 domain-containing protein [Dorea sp.]
MEELIRICQNQKNIYIYGAGRNAKLVYIFLERQEILTKGFIVTERFQNPETLFGHAVITIDKLPRNEDYIILVPVSEVGIVFKEICSYLVENQIHNVYFFTGELLERIRKEEMFYKVKDVLDTGIYHFEEKVPVEDGYNIFSMRKEGEEYHWRFQSRALKEPDINIHRISDCFSKMSALEEFERQYGKYHVFETMEARESEMKRIGTVYMACSHVDKIGLHNSLPAWITPIQVGAELTDRNLCEVRDNTGENISARNRNYSECTALFWMWKNAPRVDYIGLCHYRRHFNLKENRIGQMAASGLDVLVTAPTFVNETIGNFFSTLTPKVDLKVMLKVIEEVYPEYKSTAERFLASRFYPPCNLFIMKYGVFQEYARFVFSVTFGIEQFYDDLGFCREDRYMGYIIECLLGIFLMKNKDTLKIGYTDMKFYS